MQGAGQEHRWGETVSVTQGQSEPQFPHLGRGASPLSPLSLGHGLLQGPKGDKGRRGDLVSGWAGDSMAGSIQFLHHPTENANASSSTKSQ